MTPRADLPAAVVERVANSAYRKRNPSGIWAGLDGYTKKEWCAVLNAALAEFLAIIEELAGPDWSINYGPSRQPAQVGRVSLAELLEAVTDAD